ncbi:uncharacterized protein [Centruroides vittatus]|uniref:uncharacterized protein n=1 Tax=Centruroides vittatus TaxID=120091 RepID=UPI0035102BEF
MEKKSKFLSWLKFSSHKNSSKNSHESQKTENNVPAVGCMTNMYHLSNSNGEIFLPIQCCQHCIHQPELLSSQNLCQNSCKMRNQKCGITTMHTKYDEITKHMQALKVNNENLLCGSHREHNCCWKYRPENQCYPKAFEFRTNSKKSCCQHHKCSKKYYKFPETSKTESCKQPSKYRSIGVNTTPQKITTTQEQSLKSADKCLDTYQNFPHCSRFRHLGTDDEMKKKQTKHKRCSQIENNPKLTEYRHYNHLKVHIEDKSSLNSNSNPESYLTQSRLYSAMIHANKENRQILKIMERHRMHRYNRTLPKTWKQKVWLQDDDHKSTFADDEKSEFNDSYSTNYYNSKQTCL